jgi:hypothetical protein
VVFRYCWDHWVAECGQCVKSYRMTELASDLVSGKELLCPHCRADLIWSVRGHLQRCAMLPAAVRQRAREAREAAQRLSRALGDRADILMRELEVALRALREATVRELPRSSN